MVPLSCKINTTTTNKKIYFRLANNLKVTTQIKLNNKKITKYGLNRPKRVNSCFNF